MSTRYTFKGDGIAVESQQYGHVVVDDLTVTISDAVDVKAGPLKDTPPNLPTVTPYVSEIAYVLTHPVQYQQRPDGTWWDLVSGKELPPDVPQELESHYADERALLDDIGRKNYNRKVKLFGVQPHEDGYVLPYTQYGTEPPAGFRGNPNGDGSLVAMQVNPESAPSVTIRPTHSETIVLETPFPKPFETERTAIVKVEDGQECILRVHVPADTPEGRLGRLVKFDALGASNLSTAAVSVNGTLVRPRDTVGGADPQVNFTVGAMIPGADAAVPPGGVIELSVIQGKGGIVFELRY